MNICCALKFYDTRFGVCDFRNDNRGTIAQFLNTNIVILSHFFYTTHFNRIVSVRS